MELIPIFNIEHKSKNLKDTLTSNFLTLFSLDITKFGKKITKTIAGLIMEQLLVIIQKKEIEEHIIFIIDEVSIIENPILARFLSETRKYNLSLILICQYFNQISNDLKNSIFANIINYFIFRVSKSDANTLVDNLNIKIALDDIREKKIKLLTELQNRECIVRIDSKGILLPAFKAKTINCKSVPRINKTIIKDVSINEKNSTKTKTKFTLNSNTNLKDILISNSTNKKGVI